jgi:tetratricopeptide (TPR) repeat protein
MATESGNFGYIFVSVLLTSALASGCYSTMPAKPAARSLHDANNPAGRHIQVVVSSDETLPHQDYNAAGIKIPYVRQPNPYTLEDDSVPAEARSIFILADYRLKQGNLVGAASKFTELTEKYPSLSGPWVKLGMISEKQQRFPEAIEHYKNAISINRNNVNAYLALALVQRKQGYFSDANQTYLDALSVWKDFPEAHLNLAILYDLYLNNPEEAQKHYEAYNFLTGENEEKVQKWLVEVRRRTGIEQSFIDNPPANAVASAAETTNGRSSKQ